MTKLIGARGYGQADRGDGIWSSGYGRGDMVKRIGATGYGQTDRGEGIWSSG